jgi:hypothetical protein
MLAADVPCEIAWSIAPVLLRVAAAGLGRDGANMAVSGDLSAIARRATAEARRAKTDG